MKRLLFLLFLLTVSPALFAQGYETPEVVVSVEKANIAGKMYYVHKVLPKQTVYSICKAYSVTEAELVAANPDIKDGLKAGSILFVPMSAAAREAEAKKAEAKKAETRKTEARKADDRETPHGVEQVIEHRVRWYESLATVARKYGIPAAKILEYNGLEASQVVRGTVLLIPVTGEGPDPFADDPVIDDPDAAPDTPDEIGADTPEEPEAPMMPVRKFRLFTAEDPLSIALILPFNATNGKASSSFLNFYSGALIAIQEQKEKGAHIIVNVYDLALGADDILEDGKFQNSDLIIGPVEAPTLEPFLAFSTRTGIPLVSPLDHKVDSLVEMHPFLFQVPVSSDIQIDNIVAGLNARSNDNIILIAGPSAKDKEIVARIETIFQAQGVSYRKTGKENLSSLFPSGSRLSPTKVLIGSESKTFSTDVIRSLNALAKRNIPMEVWCTNRVRGFETSDPDALFNIHAHTAAPYFVDYSDPRDQDFVRKYRAFFYGEPDDFAFQGYDVFTYFISAMMKKGSAFTEQADLYPMQLLHCNFQFYRDHTESGWRNHATRNIVYNDQDFSIALTK